MLWLDPILIRLKLWVKSHARAKKFLIKFKHPIVSVLGFIYGSYLTFRYVDDYEKFPAIQFRDGLLRLHIKKGFGAKLNIFDGLIINPLTITRRPSLLQMGDGASINIKREFIIGDDVHIVAFQGATIEIGGKLNESGSGISASTLVTAYQSVEIGVDTIIAWDVYITDSDWHIIGNNPHQKNVVIGDHVWIAVGVKVLKGAIIGAHSIVGCSSVVMSGDYPSQVLIAGVPARIMKTNIPSWNRDLYHCKS